MSIASLDATKDFLAATMLPTHTHLTQYADPVLRPPSPASSIGTAYGADQTSFSDSEFQISPPAFEKKCLEALKLDVPRKEETDADKEPLICVPASDGKMHWVWEKELDPGLGRMISERIIAALGSEVARLREDDMYEKMLLQGSKAGLEPQPSTKDIDGLMMSMMGPSMDIGSGPYMGKNALLKDQRGATVGGGIIDGPWNHFGNPVNLERRESVAALAAAGGDSINTTSTTTVGKRSRNGTSRNAHNP